MRAGRLLALVAVALLGLGFLSAPALAGKKKKTGVVFFTQSPKINKAGKVNAKGTLKTATACKVSRGVKLQAVDSAGVVIGVLDGSTTDQDGNWFLSGQLPATLPAGTNYVRVKATKRAVGKFVCKAGLSPSVPIPAA